MSCGLDVEPEVASLEGQKQKANMKKLQLAIMAASLAGAMSASASVTTFGSLPGATFGGTGNPNNAVEVTTITDGGNTITLGLAAQGRYENPALGNNGNGTYYATTGANYGNPANPADKSQSTILGSTWNFDFYANIAGGGNLSGYTFVLNYPLTPVTPVGNLGSLNLNAAAVAALVTSGDTLAAAEAAVSTLTTIQDGENLDFAFLATSVAGVVSPPAGSFNPNAIGDYTFVLGAYNASGTLIGQSDITVDVVPEPTTMIAGALLLLPFGASTIRILRKRQTA
jgi:hypothetical protein